MAETRSAAAAVPVDLARLVVQFADEMDAVEAALAANPKDFPLGVKAMRLLGNLEGAVAACLTLEGIQEPPPYRQSMSADSDAVCNAVVDRCRDILAQQHT